MTDRKQFEAMLEALINDDQEKAKEIFHNIVVGKSREIYEELLAEDFDLNEKHEEEEEEEESRNDEAREEEEECMYEEGNEEEGEGEEKDSDEDGDVGGDAGDDFVADISDDDSDDDEEGDEDHEGEEGDEDLEDRVMDLEDALEDLKAEFEQMMGSEEHGDHDDMMGGEHDHEMGGEHDMMGGEHDMMGGEGDHEMDELAQLMEYVKEIGVPYGKGDVASTKEFEPIGANTGAKDRVAPNTKSTVASKNDMGGTARNLNQGGSNADPDGQHPHKDTKGSINPEKSEQFTGKEWESNSAPGADAGKSAFKKRTEGHGAERKGGSEFKSVGAGTGDKDSIAANKTSVIGKRVR